MESQSTLSPRASSHLLERRHLLGGSSRSQAPPNKFSMLPVVDVPDKARRRRSNPPSPLAASTPLAAAASTLAARAPPLRAVLAAVLAVLLIVGSVVAAPILLKAGKGLFRSAYYGWDPLLFGRDDTLFPSPRCCTDADCTVPHGSRSGAATPRVIALTTLRSDQYWPLLQQLECSFRKSNPGVELGVLVVQGELGAEVLAWMDKRNVTRIEVPPLYYPNHYAERYGQNWLKLRALDLVQYDAVLLLDSDLVVLRSLAPLFNLPTDFAASWDQPRFLGRFNPPLRSGINGGVLLLRPCPAVARHMIDLLDTNPKLRFTWGAAEQDFFNWYYRYTGMVLPLEYNTMASDSLRGNLTVGGRPPVVVHFTQHKPFRGPVPGKPGHQFLCTAEELARV